MDSYTITITPNDDNGNSTTLIVDTSGDHVRITDVRLHADGGLTGGQLPTVDFGLLLKAVNASSAAPTPIAAAPASILTPDELAPADVPAPTLDPVDDIAMAVDTPPAAVTAPKPRRTKRTTTEAPTPEPAAPSTARRAPTGASDAGQTTKATAVRAARGSSKTKPAAAETGTGGRAYRRMPEDFAAVYQQASTAAAIADHYGVPRHTAQGWIRRLKNANIAADS